MGERVLRWNFKAIHVLLESWNINVFTAKTVHCYDLCVITASNSFWAFLCERGTARGAAHLTWLSSSFNSFSLRQTWTVVKEVICSCCSQELPLQRDCCSQKLPHTGLRIYPHCRVWPEVKQEILMYSFTANLGLSKKMYNFICPSNNIRIFGYNWYQLRESFVKVTALDCVSSNTCIICMKIRGLGRHILVRGKTNQGCTEISLKVWSNAYWDHIICNITSTMVKIILVLVKSVLWDQQCEWDK